MGHKIKHFDPPTRTNPLAFRSQKTYVNNTFEYSVKPNIEPNQIVKGWGSFKIDPLDLNMLGQKRKTAVSIFDTAGWK